MTGEEAATMRALQMLLKDYAKQYAKAQCADPEWQSQTVRETLAEAERLLSQPVSS